MNLQEKIQYLESQMLPERIKRLKDAVLHRTKHFTMVLEDLKNPHNISAVIRTSEIFGFQDVHIIEELNTYCTSRSILKGSFKWLNLNVYSKRKTCLKKLKENGYQIAIASTHATQNLSEINFTKPTAFYLGSEVLGPHPETQAETDIRFKLPQYGLTESFNVSVCAGILMAHLNEWLLKNDRSRYTLTKEEKMELLVIFYERSRLGSKAHHPVTYFK